MKPPERFAPDDPREWLNRAMSNLALAKSKIPGTYLEDLCFEAQQAAEKAIKAVMIRRNIEFPYVHDLARLLSMLEEAGEEIPEIVRKAEELTRYALITRYPGIVRPVSEQEYAEAVAVAEEVVRWAEEMIERGNT
jgi:HEPN domain-containing protein